MAKNNFSCEESCWAVTLFKAVGVASFAGITVVIVISRFIPPEVFRVSELLTRQQILGGGFLGGSISAYVAFIWFRCRHCKGPEEKKPENDGFMHII